MPRGRVEKIQGNIATVIIERQDMCGECHACEVLGEVKKCEIQCVNVCNSQIGDEVEIDLENSSFLKASFIMYILPLIGLFVGMGIPHYLLQQQGKDLREIVSLVSGVAIMGIIFLIIKFYDKKKKYYNTLPKLTKSYK